jgi:hypothetical protein
MRVSGWFRSVLVITLVLAASSMFGQATRTWVSGVGDDVNPCSRTAPCKTFAGAISKTATGGIIDALDPGGYGTLTITKAITVEGTGTLASALNSSISGFTVNIAAGPTNRHVVLRDLSVDGAGTTLGVNGVRFISGDSLTLEHVTIKTQSGQGVDFEPNSLARLIIRDCTIAQATGSGVLVKPAVGGIARVSIHDSTITRNGTGVRVEDNSNVSIHNSHIVNNTGDGVLSATLTGAGDVVIVEDSEVSHNGGSGLHTTGGAAVLRVANSLISGNATGTTNGGGELCSFGNNQISGNTSNGTLPLPVCNPGNN